MIPTDWSPVASSNVEAVKYDPGESALHIKFKSGKVYVYDGVPPEDAEGLYHASSPSGFLRDNIIGTYEHRRA